MYSGDVVSLMKHIRFETSFFVKQTPGYAEGDFVTRRVSFDPPGDFPLSVNIKSRQVPTT